MEEKESKVTQYLVPANVSTKYEFFQGFGWAELKYVAVALIIGCVIFFTLGAFKKTEYIDITNIQNTIGMTEEEIEQAVDGKVAKKVPAVSAIIRVFFIVIPVVGAFFLVKRDPSTNMSLLYNVKGSREFAKRQKRYLYKYNSGGSK